jgi:hypothetical protein
MIFCNFHHRDLVLLVSVVICGKEQNSDKRSRKFNFDKQTGLAEVFAVKFVERFFIGKLQ